MILSCSPPLILCETCIGLQKNGNESRIWTVSARGWDRPGRGRCTTARRAAGQGEPFSSWSQRWHQKHLSQSCWSRCFPPRLTRSRTHCCCLLQAKCKRGFKSLQRHRADSGYIIRWAAASSLFKLPGSAVPSESIKHKISVKQSVKNVFQMVHFADS